MGKGIQVIDLKIDTVEVAGSSPVVPTISFNRLAILGPFSVAPKRSISGLSSCFFEFIPGTAARSQRLTILDTAPCLVSLSLVSVRHRPGRGHGFVRGCAS
jgi:hypothetical protein